MGTDVEKQNMRLTLWLWIALSVVCMSVMLWFAANKAVVIADMTPEQIGLSLGAERAQDAGTGIGLLLQHKEGSPDSFRIPLPKGVKPENIVMENRCADRELWIYIQDKNADFYRKNKITGDTDRILEGRCERWDLGIALVFRMDGVQEYRSTMDGSELTIACIDPHELYDFLVVLDPAGGGGETGAAVGGMSEKDLTLEIAKQVQKNFNRSDVRLYLTRTDDVEVSPQQRAALAEDAGADLYIRICAGYASDAPDIYGIQGRYNDEYFIPGFGNAELADTVTRDVTIAASNRAVGLAPADGDSVLYGLGIPAMELYVGYLTNAREEALLEQEAYRERLALGIIKGIGDACGRLKELGTE